MKAAVVEKSEFKIFIKIFSSMDLYIIKHNKANAKEKKSHKKWKKRHWFCDAMSYENGTFPIIYLLFTYFKYISFRASFQFLNHFKFQLYETHIGKR